jgi:hypothetical protein
MKFFLKHFQAPSRICGKTDTAFSPFFRSYGLDGAEKTDEKCLIEVVCKALIVISFVGWWAEFFNFECQLELGILKQF